MKVQRFAWAILYLNQTLAVSLFSTEKLSIFSLKRVRNRVKNRCSDSSFTFGSSYKFRWFSPINVCFCSMGHPNHQCATPLAHPCLSVYCHFYTIAGNQHRSDTHSTALWPHRHASIHQWTFDRHNCLFKHLGSVNSRTRQHMRTTPYTQLWFSLPTWAERIRFRGRCAAQRPRMRVEFGITSVLHIIEGWRIVFAWFHCRWLLSMSHPTLPAYLSVSTRTHALCTQLMCTRLCVRVDCGGSLLCTFRSYWPARHQPEPVWHSTAASPISLADVRSRLWVQSRENRLIRFMKGSIHQQFVGQ